MDYIHIVKQNPRRYIGLNCSKTYLKRKQRVIIDFLFFQKKIKKLKKFNQFRFSHIEEYLHFKKTNEGLSDATLREKRSIISAFFKRNSLGVF